VGTHCSSQTILARDPRRLPCPSVRNCIRSHHIPLAFCLRVTMIHTFVEPPAEYYFPEEAANPAPQVQTALEKTRMCLYFLQGRCKYTDCSFAHSHDELKQAPSNLRKTKMCELFLAGCCPNETECNFAHSMEELKVRSKRSMSSSLSPTFAITSLNSQSFELPAQPAVTPKSSHQVQSSANSEFCARTILSMLIKMQPEAAVAFLSNPECKLMLERLLEEEASSSVPVPPPAPFGPGCISTPSSSSQSVGILTPQLGRDSISSFFLDESMPPGITTRSSSTPFDIHHPH
jgi:hypothetical protein